jgi:hypothetical protein
MHEEAEFETYQIAIGRARSVRSDVWRHLTAFPEIVAVSATRRPDVLEVYYVAGNARPSVWLATLSAAGYKVDGSSYAL